MFILANLEKPTEEELKQIEKYGCCTGWELLHKYGITSQKVSTAIKRGAIMGVKKTFENGDYHSRNYIVKNEQFWEYVEKNKRFENVAIQLSNHGKVNE